MSKVFIADKETLDKIYDIISKEEVYGFIEHCAILAPDRRIEYIGRNKDYEPVSITMGGGYSLGSWANFSVLANNKPWMVKSDGTPDYELNENDYTKKAANNNPSDVANTSYDGGAFSWICKIYKKEYMIGDDRYVLFSSTAREGFHADGFINGLEELDGVWLPMFYNANGETKATCISELQPEYGNSLNKKKVSIDAFSSRAKFFGGPIVHLIQDLLIMWAKTTDTQKIYGYGNCGGYNSSIKPTYGVLKNSVVAGGQFYGTNDKKSLNKILHSIVLGSYQQYIMDPYIMCVNGKLKVSKDYTYDLTGENYIDTGIDYNEASISGFRYPHKYKIVPEFGAVPIHPFKGSSQLGGGGFFYVNLKNKVFGGRFGICGYGSDNIRTLNIEFIANSGSWFMGSAILLLPPVGIVV